MLNSFFDQHFSNLEVNLIEKLRKNRDGQYYTAFENFGHSGSSTNLMKALRQEIKQLEKQLSSQSVSSIKQSSQQTREA